MFIWFLEKMPKEKHILNAQKSSLKSSLDVSHSQVLQLHSGFRKRLCSFSTPKTYQSPAPQTLPPHRADTPRLLFWSIFSPTTSLWSTSYSGSFFSHFTGSGTQGRVPLGEYSPPCCTCTSFNPQQPVSGGAGILPQRSSDSTVRDLARWLS